MADDADLSGGTFYLGYYQDDLVGQAIEYKKLNWLTGFCATCDGGISQKRYNSISKHVNMRSFYVPSANLDPAREMFSPEAVIEKDTTNWGFNFNISINCDLTNFWCDNRHALKKLLSLKVTQKVFEGIMFSQQINSVEEGLKMMVIRALE